MIDEDKPVSEMTHEEVLECFAEMKEAFEEMNEEIDTSAAHLPTWLFQLLLVSAANAEKDSAKEAAYLAQLIIRYKQTEDDSIPDIVH